MFFVKHAGQSKLAPVIQPLVLARFLLRINDDGLSYIEDYHEVMTFPRLIVISLSGVFMRPMWQLLQMLVYGTISRISLVCFLQKDFGVDGAGWIIRFWPIFWNSNLDSIWDQPPILMSVSFVIGWSGFLTFFQIWRLPLSRALSGWETLPSQSQYPLSAQSVSSHWFWNLGDHFRSSLKSSKNYANLWINSTKSTLGFT